MLRQFLRVLTEDTFGNPANAFLQVGDEGMDSLLDSLEGHPDDDELYHTSPLTLRFTHSLLSEAYNSHLMAKKMVYSKILSVIIFCVAFVGFLTQGECLFCISSAKIAVSLFCLTVLAVSWSLTVCNYVQSKLRCLDAILYGCSGLILALIMVEISSFEATEIIPEYAIIPLALSTLLPFIGGVTVHVNFAVIGISHCFMLLGSFCLLRTLRYCSGMKHGSFWIFATLLFLINLISLVIAYSMMRNNIQLFVIYQKYRRIRRDTVSEKAEELKRSYIAQTLHDIGTPMNTLTLGLDLLKQSALTPDQREIVETCECSVEMMCLTRRKAMDYAKYRENETLRARLTRVNLRELILNKCKRIMSGFNDGGGVEMQFIVADGVADFIISDRDWLWEMLSNFLSNAKKFTHTGHVITEVRLSADRQELFFEVRDTGIGIPGKRKEALFRPFSQLQRGAGGTGLGLYGVKVKSGILGGSCGARDNTIDKVGTIFWFSIPYKPDLSERDMEVESILMQNTSLRCSPTLPSAKPFKATSVGQGGKVPEFLYVEDSAVMRKMVSASLTKLGVQVHVACDGEEALEKLKVRLFSLVLIDLGLPKISGQEVLKELRAFEELTRRERQPAAIVSGTVVQAEVDEALSAGADFFLPKPTTADQIMKVYQEVQRRRQEIAQENPAANKNSFVLVIEDEMSTRKFLVKILEKFGYTVFSARDGAEGLAKLQEQEYFVVFCDLNMPVMDGFECIQRFRRWEMDQGYEGSPKSTHSGMGMGQIATNTPDSAAGVARRKHRQIVYALSAASTDIDKNQALKVGMDEFLEKPIKIKKLQKVLEILEQSRPRSFR